jgi:hypothetical protein
LGKIIFVVDDFYYGKVKLHSSFRMKMANQPSADRMRNYFQAQLDKFTIEINRWTLLTFFFLVYIGWTHFTGGVNNLSSLLLGEHPNKKQLNYLCIDLVVDLIEISGGDDLSFLLNSFFKESKIFEIF